MISVYTQILNNWAIDKYANLYKAFVEQEVQWQVWHVNNKLFTNYFYISNNIIASPQRWCNWTLLLKS